MIADEQLDELERTAQAATGGPWHWAGNTDTGEPYLATWTPGFGRCQVLAIGSEDRVVTEREKASYAEYLSDCGYETESVIAEKLEEYVEAATTDQHGQAIQVPRLRFSTDLMMVKARELAIYEVAPGATSRHDPKVYRADITGIRHPDAKHLAAASPQVVLALIERLREAEAALEQQLTGATA